MSNEKNIDIFDMDVNDDSLSFLNKKTSNKDGIYRPLFSEAKDKSKGYIATIRFLPNLLEDGTGGPSAIEKFQHFAKVNDQELRSYYDCAGSNCELCKTFFKLKKSSNQAEVERSQLIKRNAKYYSFIQVIEDVQHPELVGKVLIYPYGVKIKEKINLEKTGEITGEPCNVFDMANGKDFRLIIKQNGDFTSYDSSTFRERSAIKLFDEASQKMKEVPTEFNEEKGKYTIPAKYNKMVKEYLLKRDGNLSDFEAKEWSDNERDKVNRLSALLLGSDIDNATTTIRNNNTSTAKKSSSVISDDIEDADDFFNSED